MKYAGSLTALTLAGFLMSSAAWAGPKVVSGPGVNPQCFKPWSDTTKFLQWEKRPGPYKIALANGFVGNTWRIQMIKTAKAFAEEPDIKKHIKEFKVVSTGTDAAAQLGAIEDFINQGYDAIIVNAVSPEGFDRIIRLADKNNVVLVPFDNVLDTDKVMEINEDQKEAGRMSAEFLLKEMGKTSGDILEVRGLPGNSVDRDRHDGFRAVIDKPPNKFNVTEVVGNWDTGTSQKVTADALAVHPHFDGIFSQGGDDGTVQAFLDAKRPLVPFAGEGENEFRKQIAEYSKDGLKGLSYGQSPALVAISIKAAIEALQGNVMPQLISIPIPVATYQDLKAGENYWPDLKANFFAPNQFTPCGVNFTAPEIMAQSEKNTK
ncbi:MAG TPA: sugar ABC transporter substrate-binding protein [Roseiarcus sp.]|jgi:ribose transport system substrate-binding protein